MFDAKLTLFCWQEESVGQGRQTARVPRVWLRRASTGRLPQEEEVRRQEPAEATLRRARQADALRDGQGQGLNVR